MLVSRDRATLRELPPNARIGTGSVRRACQLRARRPDVQVLDIRGNVDTRLRKLDAGEFDAIVLAGAGLARLGLADRVTEWLATDVMLPAVGQGALAVQVRRADDEAVAWIQAVADAATTAALEAERSFLARLGAGCAAAVGALAMTGPDETLSLEGMIGAPAGTSVRGSVSGPTSRAAELGTILGNILLGGGGERFLAEGRGAEP